MLCDIMSEYGGRETWDLTRAVNGKLENSSTFKAESSQFQQNGREFQCKSFKRKCQVWCQYLSKWSQLRKENLSLHKVKIESCPEQNQEKVQKSGVPQCYKNLIRSSTLYKTNLYIIWEILCSLGPGYGGTKSSIKTFIFWKRNFNPSCYIDLNSFQSSIQRPHE